MVEVPLTQNKVALIDDQDSARVLAYRWHASKDRSGNFYAKTRMAGKRVSMHRFILELGETEEVDHKNRNGLDNRRENLRPATRQQNLFNRNTKRGASGYKGVSWKPRQRKWQAALTVDRKQIYLGLFTTAEEAARAYDIAARQHHGAFAVLNFSERQP